MNYSSVISDNPGNSCLPLHLRYTFVMSVAKYISFFFWLVATSIFFWSTNYFGNLNQKNFEHDEKIVLDGKIKSREVNKLREEVGETKELERGSQKFDEFLFSKKIS